MTWARMRTVTQQPQNLCSLVFLSLEWERQSLPASRPCQNGRSPTLQPGGLAPLLPAEVLRPEKPWRRDPKGVDRLQPPAVCVLHSPENLSLQDQGRMWGCPASPHQGLCPAPLAQGSPSLLLLLPGLLGLSGRLHSGATGLGGQERALGESTLPPARAWAGLRQLSAGCVGGPVSLGSFSPPKASAAPGPWAMARLSHSAPVCQGRPSMMPCHWDQGIW